MERFEPPLRGRSNRVCDVGSKGEGLITGSLVRHPKWTRSKCEKEVTSPVLNILILLTKVGEEIRSIRRIF